MTGTLAKPTGTLADPTRTDGGGPSTGEGRGVQLLRALTATAGGGLSVGDAADAMFRLTAGCARLLGGATVAFMLSDPAGDEQVMACSTRDPRTTALFTDRTGPGPADTCARTGSAIELTDLTVPGSAWEQWSHRATAAGYVSAHAVPMRAGDAALGSFTVLGRAANSVTAAHLTLARTLADTTAAALARPVADTRPERLHDARGRRHTRGLQDALDVQDALGVHVVIEQAKGAIAIQTDLTVTEANLLLRFHARMTATPVAELARSVVTGQVSVETLLWSRDRD